MPGYRHVWSLARVTQVRQACGGLAPVQDRRQARKLDVD